MADDVEKADAFVGIEVEGERATYRILKAIGAGGMGAVFLAETVGDGRKVAVKFLHKELSAEDDSSRERFEREMKVLQDLKAFRGIVQYEDSGVIESGQLFLVMEFVSAPTLDHIISENPNGLPQIKAIQIVIEILSVLEPIHHRRFVHRDLKPHNICVYDEPLAVRLLDFGLSKPYMEGLGYEKVTRRMQGKGAEIPGSPHYMAVEQFLRPKEVDSRTDLYSCGIILYELLAGIPPFRGIYLQDILQQHQKSPPPPIDSCADGGSLSYRLWAVLEKALSKKAESRYKDAAEFKEALFDVLNVLNKRDKPKKKLDDKYRMIKKIGTGGNSEVFEVETKEGGERFAMKIARDGASDWDEETLMNEADRALKHENIVHIHEFGTFQGRPALAMELLEGGSLEDILEELDGEGMQENVFYRTMIDICRGLHHAHQKNIVHRDVKPGNMLRNKEGRTKVCDFGIAKRFEQSGDEMTGGKNTTMAKGTAQYISPEQCDLQGRVDRRADIYCLGVMMYEMLAGKLPFTDGILIMQHLQTNPPPLFVKGEFRNPDALCKIVERAMHKKPECRFQSMKDLAQELVRVSKLEPQTKAHKAVVLQTLPDEYLDAKTTKGKTEGLTSVEPIQTGMSRKKVVGIIGAVVVVMIGIMIAFNNGKNTNPNPNPVTIDDAKKQEIAALENFIEEGDWAGLAGFEIAEIKEDESAKEQLVGRLLDRVSGEVLSPKGGVSAASMEGILNEAEAAIASAANVGVADKVMLADLAVATEFCKSARAFSAKIGGDQSKWVNWQKPLEDDLLAKASALKKSNGRLALTLWQEYLDSQKTSLAKRNLGVFQSTMKNLGPTWDEAYNPWREDLIARPGEMKDSALASIRDWARRQLKAADSLDAVGNFMAKEALAAGGMDADKLASRLKNAANIRNDIADKVKPRTPEDAVVYALVESSDDSELTSKLAGFLRDKLGLNPIDWTQKAEEIEKSGFSFALFSQALAQWMSLTLDDVAMGEAVQARMAGLGGDDEAGNTAKGQAAIQERDAATKLLARGDLAFTDNKGVLNDKWFEIYKDFRFDQEGTWNSLNEGAIASLQTDLKPAEVFAVMRDVQEFQARYKDSLTAVQQNGILAAAKAGAERLQTVGNDFLLYGFAKEFEDLNLAVLSPLVVPQKLEELKSGLMKDPKAFSANLVVGDGPKFLNAAWADSEDPRIQVDLEVSPILADLMTQQLVTVESNTAKVTVQEDGKTLRVTGSPKDLLVTGGERSGNSAPLSLSLVLNGPAIGIKGQEFNLPIDSGQFFDFEAPKIEFSTQRQGTSAKVTVSVDDAELGNEVPKLQIAGKDVRLQKDQGKSTFSATVRLGSGIPATDQANADLVQIEMADASQNSVDLSDKAWAQEIAKCRESLVESEANQIVGSFNNTAGQISLLSRSNLQKGRSALESAASSFMTLQGYGTRKETAGINQVHNRALQVAQSSWNAGRLEKEALQALEGDFNAYFASLGKLGGLVQNNSAASAQGGIWSNLQSQAGRQSSSNNSNSNSNNSTTSANYKPDPTISALGVTFHRFNNGGRPVWVADVEVSQGFAEKYDADLLNQASQVAKRLPGLRKLRWLKKSSLPMAPMTPLMANSLVNAINQREGQSLSQSFGGPVEVVIPDAASWTLAGRKQANGKTYAWGDDRVSSFYRYRGEKAKNKNPWYNGLKDVTEDEVGPFKFMSGNASEIVRLSSGARPTYGLKGGSMYDACYRSEKLEISASPEPLSAGVAKYFSGLRLAIEPKGR